MTSKRWYSYVRQDAARRNIPELKPLITLLEQATNLLRQSDWTMPPPAKPANNTSDESV
tara:strand:- start:1249 stop:1425 length:177 start_codon:yes stop_codon:yes gene_type:complete